MIQIKGLSRHFQSDEGPVAALDGLSVDIDEGEFFVLLGPSGCGKTTLLRCIAGLERPDDGAIAIEGRPVYSGADRVFVPPEKRRLGMIFQSYAIWPHMTVYDNIARPLREGWCKLPKAEVPARVAQALAMVGLEDVANRPAPLLSGGQQQRVALARALAVEPSVLLMDEPLSNLDARLRDEVREQIKMLTQRLGMTVVYVTHDQHEAMDLAHRIAVMHRGRITQVGSPRDIYLAPASMRLAEFMGNMNWIPGRLGAGGAVETGLGAVRLGGTVAAEPGRAVTLGLRPSAFTLLDDDAAAGPGAAANRFSGMVVASTFLGEHVSYIVECGGVRLELLAPWDRAGRDVLAFGIDERAISVFDTEGGKILEVVPAPAAAPGARPATG